MIAVGRDAVVTVGDMTFRVECFNTFEEEGTMLNADILKELERVANDARPPTLTVADRQLVYSNAKREYVEVEPRRRPNRTHTFHHLGDLADYLNKAPTVSSSGAPVAGVILVSEGGVKVVMDEYDDTFRDVLTVPFFKADHPKGEMWYEDLLAYLDKHTGHITNEPEIRAVLQYVKVNADEELVLRDAGATTRIELKLTKGVQGGGSTPVNLPKTIEIVLRLGTREYEEAHTFSLRVRLVDKTPVFLLEHIDRDQALDRFLERALQDLRGALPGWRIYRGA